MYVAKVNDRGRASCVYMFDEQLVNFDDVFSKSYFMKKSSDKQNMIDFSHKWNRKHKNVIYRNELMHYANVICKGILQAPALIVLYSCIVMGAMLLFGSENFYNQVDLYGVEAFGNIRTAVIVTYVVSAVVGLVASLTTYNNVLYKFIRCIVSICTFIIMSPIVIDTAFFAASNQILTLTIIAIVGCFFVRFILDRLIVNVIRKETEKLIREEYSEIDDSEADDELIVSVKESGEKILDEIIEQEVWKPVMEKVRNKQRLIQYRKR